nr:hypothetical protein GCM10020185_35160 [Pseudomonas brassicacearum subsp. brassicacearum]
MIERVRSACAEGRQAYWVCTLIEESEELTCQAAETTYEDLTAALGELKVGLIHGRMKPAEKKPPSWLSSRPAPCSYWSRPR